MPPQPRTGRRRIDDRKVINGIPFVLMTGCRWGDMPSYYGSPVTAWRRLKVWSDEGICNQIMEALRNSAYHEGKISIETVCVDSSFIETKKGEEGDLQDSIKSLTERERL